MLIDRICYNFLRLEKRVDNMENKNQKTQEELSKAQKFINSLTDVQKIIYDVISDKPIHVDKIINLTGESTAKVMASLTILEIYGLIKLMPGKYYVRK